MSLHISHNFPGLLYHYPDLGWHPIGQIFHAQSPKLNLTPRLLGLAREESLDSDVLSCTSGILVHVNGVKLAFSDMLSLLSSKQDFKRLAVVSIKKLKKKQIYSYSADRPKLYYMCSYSTRVNCWVSSNRVTLRSMSKVCNQYSYTLFCKNQ